MQRGLHAARDSVQIRLLQHRGIDRKLLPVLMRDLRLLEHRLRRRPSPPRSGPASAAAPGASHPSDSSCPDPDPENEIRSVPRVRDHRSDIGHQVQVLFRAGPRGQCDASLLSDPAIPAHGLRRDNAPDAAWPAFLRKLKLCADSAHSPPPAPECASISAAFWVSWTCASGWPSSTCCASC